MYFSIIDEICWRKESFRKHHKLFIHWVYNLMTVMEETLWLSVQSVEPMLVLLERNGRWLVDLTKRARGWSWRSVFSIAQNARNLSELPWANKRSNFHPVSDLTLEALTNSKIFCDFHTPRNSVLLSDLTGITSKHITLWTTINLWRRKFVFSLDSMAICPFVLNPKRV